MEFCEECGSMMRAEDELWVCVDCSTTHPKDPSADYVLTEPQEASEIVDVSEAQDRGLPTTNARCPDCGHDRAHWYMQQIRAADESETRFFICTECEHRWREDDH